MKLLMIVTTIAEQQLVFNAAKKPGGYRELVELSTKLAAKRKEMKMS